MVMIADSGGGGGREEKSLLMEWNRGWGDKGGFTSFPAFFWEKFPKHLNKICQFKSSDWGTGKHCQSCCVLF